MKIAPLVRIRPGHCSVIDCALTLTLATSLGACTSNDKVDVTNPSVAKTISEAGGTLANATGSVQLLFPANAVSRAVEITVFPKTNITADNRVIPNTVYEFGPDGTTFRVPVILTLRFDSENLQPGISMNQLAIHKLVADQWIEVIGSTVNADQRAVTAEISSFSAYGIRAKPPAAVDSTASLPDAGANQRPDQTLSLTDSEASQPDAAPSPTDSEAPQLDAALSATDANPAKPDSAVLCAGQPCECKPGETKPCENKGECSGGARACIEGRFGPCTWDKGPTPEICNGKDDDCDGVEDEGVDCGSGLCRSGVCVAANHCSDLIKNADEVWPDCGDSCPPCSTGSGCTSAQHCQSGVCSIIEGHTLGQCAVPTCSDGKQNGDESDTDCGGSACVNCPSGMDCRSDSDCVSADCNSVSKTCN